MPATVVRFNLVDPAASPGPLSHRYRAALEMAAYADEHGVATLQTEEHHGSPDGWLPSPLTFAGAALGATRRIAVTVSALIGPLYDPLRLAEDLAVLDHVGGGRLVTVAGIGYRPEEYAALGVDWHRRGALQDELLDTLLKAWTGEPFEFRGRTVRVTPRPHSSPHPLLIVGGSSRAAARRAARFGLPFFPSAHLPELETYYREQLAEHGTEGWCLMPPPQVPLLHLSEDPDRTWTEYGRHLFHEAATYASWQSAGIRSAVRSTAASPEELRREGVYRVVTPDECVAFAEAATDPAAALVLHPLCGGMPVEEGWRSLRLFAEQVLPRLKE
ncbi:LLM class flavin-dependent oxidoreductase [Actinacidiphila glaucinigra]|uniref:Flavin-dependent oxidoreductase, luciferase family (Includes alkanesulfonate monooxygenase SsuD and methylene tetrahydromethanopterin reductase) n=1 Tax=Actinacidiphila glaucinigra TaxID=235986 RepID=A0A239GWY8_9ACTN|nr:LLM class flavin-dependent oxidoreductase [Actinacidiphila glaucinigra]SNS73451.1 Flavin-dependent oxidoreductase, luciferase family (includes alkanesulfonate monooxygenase SsuD and methylene tetrahydromethanopterin reductase) [Actinacidiphila glaucinigra]